MGIFCSFFIGIFLDYNIFIFYINDLWNLNDLIGKIEFRGSGGWEKGGFRVGNYRIGIDFCGYLV